MTTNVHMPQLGESIAEGTIVRWNKSVGDPVEQDEPLFEISTDKVDAEIPAPTAGVLSEIRVREGETVPVDSVVAVISQTQQGDVGRSLATTETTQATPPAAVSVERRTPRPAGRQVGVSPLVRKLAGEHGIDLGAIMGTGAGGRVTKTDVLRYLETVRSEDAAGVTVTAQSAEVEPLSTMRRRIAEHMVRSRRTAAHAHTVFDVDCSRVSRLRVERHEAYMRAGTKLTYLAFIAKAVIDAIGEVPIVNARLDHNAENIVYHRDINLGVAVALEWGLIVPVIKQAAAKSLIELSRAILDLADRARAKRLRPEEVEGGTFTITNPGAFGSILGMPIINQPQVAILCVGAIAQRPTVVDDAGTIEARPRCYLTLSFDHRLIDGAVADRFMGMVKAGLERFDAGLL